MSKSLLLFTYLILFQLIIEVKSQNTLVPRKRGAHTATLIDKKLYILGGYSLTAAPNDDEIVGSQFFYVDLSKPFVSIDINWIDLSNIPLIPAHKRAAAVKGGEGDDKLILYGGEPVNRDLAPVYVFDTKSSLWSVPSLSGNYNPLKKSSLFPVVSNKKMF